MGFFDSLLHTAVQIYEWWDTRQHGEGSHYHYEIERSLDTLGCRVPVYVERYQGIRTRTPIGYSKMRESVAYAMRKSYILPDTELGILRWLVTIEPQPTPPSDLLLQLLSD